MDGTQNFNIAAKTIEQCLKTENQFGQRIYHNLCDGSHYVVPWGGVTWVFTYIGFGILAFFCLLALAAIVGAFFAAAADA